MSERKHIREDKRGLLGKHSKWKGKIILIRSGKDVFQICKIRRQRKYPGKIYIPKLLDREEKREDRA